MAFGERPNGKPDEPVWIGVKTTATGRIFDGQAQDTSFEIDVSHGDGFGGLTENQRNVYIQVLTAAVDRLRKQNRVQVAPGVHAVGN